jgi:microcystin-dependent protein
MNNYIGQILLVAFNFAPVGWALCNGQTLSISANTALFSLIGTTYGGDGVSNFMLPNLQSRVPVHQGTGQNLSTYVMGQVGGVEQEILLVGNLPSHTHPVNCNNTPGPNADPTNGFWAEVNTGGREPAVNPAYATSANKTMAPTAIGLTGSNQPFSVVQPYLCMNYIIALQGIFPSRG